MLCKKFLVYIFPQGGLLRTFQCRHGTPLWLVCDQKTPVQNFFRVFHEMTGLLQRVNILGYFDVKSMDISRIFRRQSRYLLVQSLQEQICETRKKFCTGVFRF